MFSVITRSAARRTPTLVRCASQARPPRKPNASQATASANADEANPTATKDENTRPAEESAPSSSTAEGSAAAPAEEAMKPLPSLDISPLEVGEGEPQRTGAKSSRDNVTSAEKQRRMASRVTMALLALGFGLNVAYMGRDWEDYELAEKKWKREDAPNTRWLRTKERFSDIFDYFNKPSFPELLPPPMPAPHQKPYTLVISLDDLLITSTWDRQHGWRTAKRPGVDYFLGYISQFYEVVLFTTQNSYTAAPIVESLDRYNFYITYKLFRDATRSINGEVVKDLSYLNRDLSKVIVLDTVPEHVKTHPENAIVIPKWKGDPKDRGLVAMIPFLESIGIYKPPDVRPILQHYQGKNIPLEYAKTEAAAKAKHIEEWNAKHHHAPSASSLSLTGLFGGSATPQAPTLSKVPPTFLEQKRFEAQMQYKEEQAWIAKNKDYLEKLREQDEAAAQAAMPSNIWEALDQMAGNPPPTPKQPGAEDLQAPPPTSSTSTPSK